MTPLFFQDEVFLDCSKDLDTSACTFTFKGKEIYLQHSLEIKPKQRVHRMTCKGDGQTFNFGAGRSTLGGGTFGTWPKIVIDGKNYRFRINWSTGEGQKGIKFEAENNPKQLSDVLQAVAEAKIPNAGLNIHYLSDEIRKRWSEETRKRREQKQAKEESESTNQEELDDIEGFLHIHTLPPEARKRVIEQVKNRKKNE